MKRTRKRHVPSILPKRQFRVESLETRLALSGIPLVEDASTQLLLPFDESYTGASQEIPSEVSDTGFRSGLVGHSMHAMRNGFVKYATSDKISAASGTVEFWIRPDWNGADGGGHTFFEVGDNFNNGTILAIDGANNLRFQQWGDDPTTPAVERNVERDVGTSGRDWVAGQWYHVAATWNGTVGEMNFYIDGELVGARNDAVSIAEFSTEDLTIGAEAIGNLSAEASFDEFRISDRMRTASEIMASYRSGLCVLPSPPLQQAAYALNETVHVEWLPLEELTPDFDHYAVYRSTLPFSSVTSLSPIATINDVQVGQFVDAHATNGVPYFYAVTTVFRDGAEQTNLQSIGPRTPRSETDLQVVSIGRTPEFARYDARYTSYSESEPSGYGPYTFTASTALGNGQSFDDPRTPAIGNDVTYTATIRNRGTNTVSGAIEGIWSVDSSVVSTQSMLVTLDPNETATYSFVATWDNLPHKIEFEVDIADSRADNNRLSRDALGVPFLTYIDRSFAEQFREEYSTAAQHNDDIIDWLNSHMERFNQLFVESGTNKQVHYGVLEVVDDYEPLPDRDQSPFAIFPLHYNLDAENPRTVSAYYNDADDIDYGLLHEMGHQLGLIDIYQLNVSASANQVSGLPYTATAGLMNGVSPFLSSFSALAMEHWLHDAHGYYGQFMYNLPETIELKLVDRQGIPLANAQVKVYQYADRPGQGKVITDQVKFAGSTDAEGMFTLPNVSIDPSIVPEIGTGDSLRDNPFGYLAVVGTNGVLHFAVEYDGETDFAWLDVTEANVAYWRGAMDVATFERRLSLGGPIDTDVPGDLTELNADDWFAWAESATASTADDTVRKTAGQSSVRFTTDGGFDTLLRYEPQQRVQWDLTNVQSLAFDIFADNPNPPRYQVEPIVRLLDTDGDAVEYRYFQGGTPHTLWNDAIDEWLAVEIPLAGQPSPQTGWRRTGDGSFDWSLVKTVEVHADTWDFGFTLWLDNVHFRSGVAGDSNLDGRFDSSDLVQVFQVGEYEDGVLLNSNWSDGDWTGDGEFDTTDLVFAFQAGTYVSAASQETSSAQFDAAWSARKLKRKSNLRHEIQAELDETLFDIFPTL